MKISPAGIGRADFCIEWSRKAGEGGTDERHTIHRAGGETQNAAL